MPAESSKPWFRAKRYGYGSGLPIAWQGWVVLVAFLAIVTGSIVLLPMWTAQAVDIVAVIVLVVVCATKTEGGWRWTWGRKR